jgi:hypothetical protein
MSLRSHKTVEIMVIRINGFKMTTKHVFFSTFCVLILTFSLQRYSNMSSRSHKTVEISGYPDPWLSR